MNKRISNQVKNFIPPWIKQVISSVSDLWQLISTQYCAPLHQCSVVVLPLSSYTQRVHRHRSEAEDRAKRHNSGMEQCVPSRLRTAECAGRV